MYRRLLTILVITTLFFANAIKFPAATAEDAVADWKTHPWATENTLPSGTSALMQYVNIDWDRLSTLAIPDAPFVTIDRSATDRPYSPCRKLFHFEEAWDTNPCLTHGDAKGKLVLYWRPISSVGFPLGTHGANSLLGDDTPETATLPAFFTLFIVQQPGITLHPVWHTLDERSCGNFTVKILSGAITETSINTTQLFYGYGFIGKDGHDYGWAICTYAYTSKSSTLSIEKQHAIVDTLALANICDSHIQGTGPFFNCTVEQMVDAKQPLFKIPSVIDVIIRSNSLMAFRGYTKLQPNANNIGLPVTPLIYGPVDSYPEPDSEGISLAYPEDMWDLVPIDSNGNDLPYIREDTQLPYGATYPLYGMSYTGFTFYRNVYTWKVPATIIDNRLYASFHAARVSPPTGRRNEFEKFTFYLGDYHGTQALFLPEIPPSITNNASISITGQANVNVMINNVSVVTSLGRYSETIPLVPGDNVITVVATDVSGECRSAVYHVMRSEPALPVLSVPLSIVTSTELYTITGKVVASSMVTLEIDGVTTHVQDDGTFSASGFIHSHDKDVTVSVTDSYGHVVSSVVHIHRITKVTVVLVCGSPIMQVDSVPKMLDAVPIIVQGRTLLPIRALIESLGGTISWDAVNRIATCILNNRTAAVTIGNTMAMTNGKTVYLDVAAIISNGHTMLPLRFVAESLGCTVNWDQDTRKITVIFEQ